MEEEKTEESYEFSSEEDYSQDSPLEPSPKHLNLDELFGFSAARKRLEEKKRLAPVEPKFFPHRAFINNVDIFNAKHISAHLTSQIVGATKAKEEEEEEEEEEEPEVEEDELGLEESDENAPKKEKVKPEPSYYEVVATLKDKSREAPEEVKEIIKEATGTPQFLEKIMKCGFIIYDISVDSSQIGDAMWTLKAIEKELDAIHERTPLAFANLQEIRHFILLSTVMTWSLTKPVDPDDPELPFTENDYRKRKPHPNYKKHIELEHEVVQVGKKYPEKFKTIVIATGISYGYEEEVLHFLFKMAWHNKPELPVFGTGRNHVPLIHVKDIAMLIYLLLEEFPKKRKYILAVEQASSSLRKIVKAVSKGLATGEYKKVAKEEAFLVPEVTQQIFEMITVKLKMESSFLSDESLGMKWHSETGFVENIQTVVTEYRNARKLKPLKLVVLGPPASGKTTVAKQIAANYELHYLQVQEVIQYTIDKMKNKIEKLKMEEEEKERQEEAEKGNEDDEEGEEEEEEEEEEDEEDEEKETIEDITARLEELTADMTENMGQLSEENVIRLVKERMLSAPCQNQGYVLDGYPELLDQAKQLFGLGEGEEEEAADEEEDEEARLNYDRRIMPEFVICLEASDEFLCNKVMLLPESVVQNTHYAEEPMLQCLSEYRTNNTDDTTILNFFDEMEVHPMLISVEEDLSPTLQQIVETISEKIGKPRNYGPTQEELDMIAWKAEQEIKQKEEEDLERRKAEERIAHETHMQKMEEWVRLMDAMKQEEEEMLAIQSLPLRHYLMKYVFPTLTRGLMQVAQIRPSDPIDYLAEYLFRENPEGKMLEPHYHPAAEELFASIKRFQDIAKKGENGAQSSESAPQ